MRCLPFLLLVLPLLCDGGGWTCALVCVGLSALAAGALFIAFSLAGELRSLARHRPRLLLSFGQLK